jgi:hypothetical protein
MNSSRPKYEGWLYLLAFLVAIAFRFIQLGAKPLTDSEAELALQAFRLAQGKEVLLSPQPAYILFTSVLFLITEATNFMARFFPALAGSLLVLAPWFFREKLKPLPALVLAFLISFDPGLVAISRQAGGTMLALTFLLFAWGMWRNQNMIPAGIFAGLALLSGPSIWSGLLMLGLTALIFSFGRSKSKAENQESETDKPRSKIVDQQSLIALGATILLGGTLFFTVPNGLSAWVASLPAYLNGWTVPSVFTPVRTLFVFVAYEPLGIFLTIFALVTGFRTHSKKTLRFSAWLAVSLLITTFYGRPSELVWVIVPLLVLASRELARSFEIYPEERAEIGVVVGVSMILLVYTWFNISNIALNPYDQINSTPISFLGSPFQLPAGLRYVILFGSTLVLIGCLGLVALGWSPRTARISAIWSFTVFFGIYAAAAARGASGLRFPNGVELWSQEQPPVQAKMLGSTVNDVSLLGTGHILDLPVTISGVDSPALEWVLRDRDVTTVSLLDPSNPPPVIVSAFIGDPGLPAAYRGQDFTWRQTPRWDITQTPDWIRWLVFRQMPEDSETVILWVRDDLFPDAREDSQQP